ncbi:hypothetical protein WR25_23830 [Diploscapter pachys]|uniref:Uncharacterized protein n=1 Tax=Diploscapter pachys TaxID=2018661 RepID=A0A2A2J835_9BILA|nr:hypothetical protein WR25_23830 [Diploscapter pachys]
MLISLLLLLGFLTKSGFSSLSTEDADAVFYTGNGMRVLYSNSFSSPGNDPLLGLVLGLNGGVRSGYTPYYQYTHYGTPTYYPSQYSNNYNYYANNQNRYNYGYQGYQQTRQQPYGYTQQQRYNYQQPQQCRTVRFVDYVNRYLPRYYCDCPPYGVSYQYYGCQSHAG